MVHLSVEPINKNIFLWPFEKKNLSGWRHTLKTIHQNLTAHVCEFIFAKTHHRKLKHTHTHHQKPQTHNKYWWHNATDESQVKFNFHKANKKAKKGSCRASKGSNWKPYYTYKHTHMMIFIRIFVFGVFGVLNGRRGDDVLLIRGTNPDFSFCTVANILGEKKY